MPDGAGALQLVDDVFRIEVVADMAERFMGIERPAFSAADDTRRFLAPVLEGVEAERRMGRRLVMAEDSENPALLMEFVVIEWVRCYHGHVSDVTGCRQLGVPFRVARYRYRSRPPRLS